MKYFYFLLAILVSFGLGWLSKPTVSVVNESWLSWKPFHASFSTTKVAALRPACPYSKGHRVTVCGDACHIRYSISVIPRWNDSSLS